MRSSSATQRVAAAAALTTAALLSACTPDTTHPQQPDAASTTWVTVTAPPVTVTPPASPASTTWVTVTAPPVTTTGAPSRPSPASSRAPTGRGTSPSTARAVLLTLPVRAAAPGDGYTRDAFGQKHADIDRDGCDQRNDALRRDLAQVTIKPGTRGCVVTSGTLHDPYSGAAFTYRRGERSPIDFEHVVSLGNAWVTGAQLLTPQRREELANDPLNVLMTSAALNRGKGDADAAGWLPPVIGHRCAYVARQIAVKAAYSLWVTQTERAAMLGVLETCPAQPIPTRTQVAFPPPR